MRTALIPTCLFTLLAASGCNDDERIAPRDSQQRPSHDATQPMAPSRPEPQAKVSGAPADTASPALPGESGSTTPHKTSANNKVSGSPGGASTGIQPQDSHPVPPDKTPAGGKDAVR